MNSSKCLSATSQFTHATHTSSLGREVAIGYCVKDPAKNEGHLNYLFFLYPISYPSHHRKLTGLVTICLTKCTDCSSSSCPSWVWTQFLGWFAHSCPVWFFGVAHLQYWSSSWSQKRALHRCWSATDSLSCSKLHKSYTDSSQKPWGHDLLFLIFLFFSPPQLLPSSVPLPHYFLLKSSTAVFP